MSSCSWPFYPCFAGFLPVPDAGNVDRTPCWPCFWLILAGFGGSMHRPPSSIVPPLPFTARKSPARSPPAGLSRFTLSGRVYPCPPLSRCRVGPRMIADQPPAGSC